MDFLSWLYSIHVTSLNSVFLATNGMILETKCSKLDLPRLLILVFPLCLPELHSIKFSPASFCIWLGCVYLFISPTSAMKPAAVIIPTPLIVNSSFTPGTWRA